MEKLSPLYCWHNGTMLGFFMFMSRFQFAAKGFPFLRSRMQQFLNELESGIELPRSHRDFKKNFSSFYASLLQVFVEKDGGKNVPLFGPFALGFGFLAKALDMPNETDQAMIESIMEESALDPSLIEQHVTHIPREVDKISIDDVMTASLAFLREVILPLDVESDTCFVAMPFSEPFESYYPTVYQPLLAKNGFRTLRAWGGLANEFHVELMLTLIDKSGCVLVELTGLNTNVILEMGYAFGREKLVIQISDVSKPISLANVRGLAIIPYDSSKQGWEEDMLNGLGELMLRAHLKVVAEKTES